MSTTTPAPIDAPVADWVTPEAMTNAPEELADRLLREAPIAYVPFLKGYLLSSYKSIQTVLTDPAKHTVVNSDGGTTDRAVGPSLMRREGTEHTRQRTQMMPSLRPNATERSWTAVFERNAQRRLDELIKVGPGANLDTVFARPYAADNLAAIVGLPGLKHEDVVRWSHAMVAGSANLFGDPKIFAASDEANREIDAVIDDAIPYLRDHPDDSILSGFIRAEDPLPPETVRANIKLAIAGGVNEPQHMISNGVWAIARENLDTEGFGVPEFMRVFDEVIRLYPPIAMTAKKSRSDGYMLDGITIPGDTTLAVFYLAANRDPEHIELPLKFDINRKRTAIASFGIGPHVCAGSHVAKAAVAAVAWPLLYQSLQGFRPVDPDSVGQTGFVFRSLPELPVTWDVVKRSAS